MPKLQFNRHRKIDKANLALEISTKLIIGLRLAGSYTKLFTVSTVFLSQ